MKLHRLRLLTVCSYMRVGRRYSNEDSWAEVILTFEYEDKLLWFGIISTWVWITPVAPVASFLPCGKSKLEHRTQGQPSESNFRTSEQVRVVMQVEKPGFRFILAMSSWGHEFWAIQGYFLWFLYGDQLFLTPCFKLISSPSSHAVRFGEVTQLQIEIVEKFTKLTGRIVENSHCQGKICSLQES